MNSIEKIYKRGEKLRFCVLVLLLSALTAGCATTARYEAQLDTWVGANEHALIAAWGVPDKEYRLDDGRKAVAYVRKDTFQTGGYTRVEPQTTYQTGTIDGKPYSGTSTTYVTETVPVQKHKLYCKTSFVIDAQGTIESWHHEGNNCVAY